MRNGDYSMSQFQTFIHNVVTEARQFDQLTIEQLDEIIRKHDQKKLDQDNFCMAIEEIEGILRNRLLT